MYLFPQEKWTEISISACFFKVRNTSISCHLVAGIYAISSYVVYLLVQDHCRYQLVKVLPKKHSTSEETLNCGIFFPTCSHSVLVRSPCAGSCILPCSAKSSSTRSSQSCLSHLCITKNHVCKRKARVTVLVWPLSNWKMSHMISSF